MVVALNDVVDGVCSCVSADVADAVIPLENYQASGGPVLWESCLACASLPLLLVFTASAFIGCVVWAVGL